MSQQVTMTEVLGGGIWLASTVAVAGYTWRAMTGEYEKFPTLGDSNPTPTPKAVQKADAAIGLPNLPHGRKAGPFSSGQMAIAGVEASPITPDTTGVGGIVSTVNRWLSGLFG